MQSDKYMIKSFPPELSFQIKSFERMDITLFPNSHTASRFIAEQIGSAIREKQKKKEHIVLGLATGSSPIKIYSELIRMHKQEGLSLANVITFNLDEYYPMDPKSLHSYHHFMQEHLFEHVDIPPSQIHIPKGVLPLDAIEQYCADYEKMIIEAGGIDIQLLGIGRTGHIGFNEPGAELSSQTRLVRLDNITRRDAADDFGGLEHVPYKAITMGMKTILAAREIYIVAWGEHKAEIVKQAIECEPNTSVPATFLQNHDHCRFILDLAAANNLTRVQTPWKVGNCAWKEDLIHKAVIWLSRLLEKPILKLTDEDYAENGLSELLLKVDSAYQINITVFNRLQHTITGWPGGKPYTDDTHRPERAQPVHKRVLVFSPHPDDDVISMGGTLQRLVDQGHEVHVAYQTSGNIAVHHHDALRYIEFFEELSALDELSDTVLSNEALQEAKRVLSTDGGADDALVRKIKALIRRGEARMAARFCGLSDKQIHFLDMPFYETGRVRKNDIGPEDMQRITDLLYAIKPHQVFAAGDLADPHGTHRICLNAIIDALKSLKHQAWVADCWLWLYRGAWQEFDIDQIQMAVPLSPEELLKKRNAIFLHQSQKDTPPFPGDDQREFWQRSEERNRTTAGLYRKLGLAEYEAIEAFRRYEF